MSCQHPEPFAKVSVMMVSSSMVLHRAHVVFV